MSPSPQRVIPTRCQQRCPPTSRKEKGGSNIPETRQNGLHKSSAIAFHPALHLLLMMICVVLCFVRVSLSRAEIGLPFFSSAQKIQKLCAEASLCSLTFRFSGFIQSSVYYVNSSPSSMFLSSRHPVICKYQAVHTSSEISSFCVCCRFIGSFLPFFLVVGLYS